MDHELPRPDKAPPTKEITITWAAEDVLSQVESMLDLEPDTLDITDNEIAVFVGNVLDNLKQYHCVEHGINWDVIESATRACNNWPPENYLEILHLKRLWKRPAE